MSDSKYLQEAWYVAAWSNEISREMLSRQIIEKPVIVFRKENGEPAAMGGMCPHRFAPLSRGKLCGDTVQCPYHGLQFDVSGKCVLNPHGDGKIPTKMAVPSYPVVERHNLVWVWMGDPANANPDAIPDFGCHTDPDMACVGGMLEMQANYQLIIDNLMDLSHAAYVHDGLLSSPGLRLDKLETIQKGTTVYANRWMPRDEIQPAHAMLWEAHVPGERVDQWTYMRWDAPAHLLLDVGVTKVSAPRTEGIFVYGTDILTPKDEHTTYYFWAATRNYKIDDPAVDEQWRKIVELAFDGQDKPMIEAQQRMLGTRDIEQMDSVMLSIDAGATRVRRVLSSLIRDQKAPSPDHPQLQAHRRAVEGSADPVLPAV
jgi:vanillate O-demethylase monooxygenase subunit